MSERSRRWLLGAAGTGLAATAGCLEINMGGGGGGGTPTDSSSSGTPTSTDTPEPTDTPTETDTPENPFEPPEESEDTPTPEPDTPTPEPEPEAVTIANEVVRIHEDEWQAYRFSVERGAELAYQFTVRSGPQIDVYLMGESEYQQFDAGNRFRSFESHEGTTGDQMTGQLQAGTYVLVFDNSSMGATSPPSNFDDDVAETEITAAYQPPS